MVIPDLASPSRPHRVPAPVSDVTLVRSTALRERRPGCVDVARNRAARYARRHRKARMLLPLVSIAILVGIILERKPTRFPVRKREEPNSWKDEASLSPGGNDIDDVSDWKRDKHESGGGPLPQYRPPAHFLAKDAAQIVAFLIRNRGRIDNEAVRVKWELLDRFSLPVAVYLRDIEANAAWDELEKDIAAAPPGSPAMSGAGLPRSPRHRKILPLLSEWSVRGDELMSVEPAGQVEIVPAPDCDRRDDPGTKPPSP